MGGDHGPKATLSAGQPSFASETCGCLRVPWVGFYHVYEFIPYPAEPRLAIPFVFSLALA